jgi:hypothetical protein
MAELTLEQLLTAMKRRQPLPPEIRQDIIEGASKVGSFLWEGSGPGIAMNMAKMRMENPDLSLSDVFPAVVGAGVLRGGGKFRPRVVQGGFSSLDDAKKFALTAEKQRVREQTLSEIFKARRAKEAAITPEEKLLQRRVQRTEDLARRRSPEAKARRKLLQPGKLKRPTRRELSELPKEEQDRILKAFDEGRIEEVKVAGPVTAGAAIKEVKNMRPAERRKFLQRVDARIEANNVEMRGILDLFADRPLTSKGLTLQKGGLLSDGYIFNTTGQRVGKVSVSGNDITLRTFTKADAHGQQNIKKKIGTFRTMEDIIDKLEKMRL